MIRELILLISVRVYKMVHSLFDHMQIQAQWNSFVLQVEGWLCMHLGDYTGMEDNL